MLPPPNSKDSFIYKEENVIASSNMNVRWLRINYFCLASKKSTFCVCVGFYFRWRRFDFVIYGLYTLSYNFEAPIEKGNSFVYVDWNTTIRFRKVLSVVDLKWVMTLPVAASLPLKRYQSFAKLDSIKLSQHHGFLSKWRLQAIVLFCLVSLREGSC